MCASISHCVGTACGVHTRSRNQLPRIQGIGLTQSGTPDRQPVLLQVHHLRARTRLLCCTSQEQSQSVDICVVEDGHTTVFPRQTAANPVAAGKSALLILMPGAYMKPADYTNLIARLQEQLHGQVELWFAIAYPIWQEIDVKAADAMDQATARANASVQHLLQRAKDEGFPHDSLPSGRCNNLIIIAHSSAALFAAPLAARLAGALVLLGSYFFPSADYHATLREWSRPVLHLGGRLDGQARFSKLAYAAQEAAVTAYKVGSWYAAVNKPVILLPGVNHANLSNGHLSTGHFDLMAQVPFEEATEAVAGVLADFISVHSFPTQSETWSRCALSLERQCVSTALWLVSFLESLGRGNISTLWKTLISYEAQSQVGDGKDQLQEPGVKDLQLASCHGAEVLPDSDSSRVFVAHPGEVTEAEAFCTRVQKHIVNNAERWGSLKENIRVVSTVHTDVNMFIRSQPNISEVRTNQLTGHVVIQAHCYLHRPNLIPFGHRIPVSPHYVLKLKSAEGIALAASEASNVDTASVEPSISAALLNEMTLNEAIERLDDESVELYRKSGKQLVFPPDRDVSQEISSPVQWIKEMPLQFLDVQDHTTEVCSPVVRTPPKQKDSNLSHPADAFHGNLYIKCLSSAAAMEWILCDSLRPSTYSSEGS